MTRVRRTLLVVGLAAAFGACGSDEEGEPIPRAVAADLESQLDNIRDQIEDGSPGACEDIKEPNNTFDALQATVGRVPQDVDVDVRDALGQSVDRLSELVDEECASLEDTETETETVPDDTETIEIPTVPEETVPTETVPAEEEDGNELPPGQEKKLEEPNLVPPEDEPGNSGGNGGGAPVPEDDG